MDEAFPRVQSSHVIPAAIRKLRFWQLLLGVLLLMAISVVAVHFYLKWSLARYKAELIAKGEKLEVGELIPKGCADEAAVEEVWRAFRTFPPIGTDMPALMESALPGKARVRWKIHALTPEEHAQWHNLKVFSEGIKKEELDNLLEALETKCLTTGYPYNLNAAVHGLTSYKKMAQALQQLTLWNMSNGRKADALRCTIGALNAVNSATNEPVMITTLVRVSAAAIAFPSTWELLQYGDWTDEELLKLQKCWEGQFWRYNLAHTERMERALGLKVLESIETREQFNSFIFWSGGTVMETLAEAGSELFVNPKDSFEKLSEAGVLAGAYPYWKFFGRFREIEDIIRLSQKQIARVEFATDLEPLTGIALTNIDYPPLLSLAFGGMGGFTYKPKYFERISQVETLRDMAIAAIGLKRFFMRHGQYPESLEALLPEYCATMPIDGFTGRPLRYAKLPNQEYLLYSTGQDREDDGGSSGEKFMITKPNEDMVWPSPATVEEVKKAAAVKEKKRK